MTLAFSKHDHAQCEIDTLQGARARCERLGIKLTEMRERVLTLLLSKHRAIGAYDLLAELAKEGVPAQPPIIYRALAFLVDNGLAHKIEGMNAFVACQFPYEDHRAGFMICRKCERVAESQLQSNVMENGGFVVESEVVEAMGVCPDCTDGSAS